jgi:hypothetical protein
MTLDEIRKYVNYICVKENSGGTLTPQQANTVFRASNIDMFNKKIEKAQMFAIQNKIPLNEALANIIELSAFLVSQGISQGTPCKIPDWGYWSSMTTIYNGQTKKVDLLNDSDWSLRMSNLLSLPIENYPIARIVNLIESGPVQVKYIEVLPNNVQEILVNYYKIPSTPVYDYYIDASYNEVYLPAGSTHTLTSGQTGSAGQTSGTVTSLTVELEWDSLHHIEFCNEVLKKVAPNLKDQQIAAYANQAAQEQG